MKPLFTFLLLFLAILNNSPAQTPQDSIYWKITTNDGNEYRGFILSSDSTTVVLKTSNIGTITIQNENIQALEKLEPNDLRSVSKWRENHQAARYFWMPNGHGLKKNQTYYQNSMIFVNQVSLGITDKVTMGVGIIPLFFLGTGFTPIWVTPKFSMPVVKDKYSIGAGALLGGVLTNSEGNFFGITYLVNTFGNRDRNLSVGLGYGFAQREWADRPTISLGGMWRYSKKSFLMTENYLIPTPGNYFGITSFGGRTIWEAVSLDYGAIVPLETNLNFILIPWLGVSFKLGKK